MGVAEAADNWDLPQEACEEIFRYCETNQVLIEIEALEEARRFNRRLHETAHSVVIGP
jgi:hypothetical protein